MKRTLIIFPALCFLFQLHVITYAQAPLSRTFEIREGKLKPRIQCMFSDRDGMIWLGTDAGLFFFTGLDFRRPEVADSVSGLSVTAIGQDKRQRLWIGTEQGVIYTVLHCRQDDFSPEEGHPKVAISGIATDAAGTVYFATKGEGIYYWKASRLYNIDVDDGLSDNYCYGLLLTGDRLLAGTDNGISIIALSGDEKKIRTVTRKDGLSDDIVRVVRQGADGLLVGFQDGGIALLDEKFRVVPSPDTDGLWQHGQINDLLPLGDEIWIATDQAGLWIRRNGNDRSVTTNRLNLPAAVGRQTQLLADPAGNVWIASNNRLIRTTGQQLRWFNRDGDEPLNHFHCVHAEASGRIWFSPDQQLASISSDGGIEPPMRRYRITTPERLTDIVTLHADPHGGIWIGTLGEGVFRFDPNTGNKTPIDRIESIRNGSILSITGSGPDIWITGFAGVTRLTFEVNDGQVTYREVKEPPLEGLNGIYIYTAFLDSAGTLWLGTDENGLYSYRDGRLVNYTSAEGLPGNSVISICQDARGTLWVNCIDAGIARRSDGRFVAYGLEEGLTDLSNAGIQPLPDTSLLIIHDNGIDRFDPNTGTISPFHPDETLTDINPDINTSCIDRDGSVWIGTEKGLLRVHTKGNERFNRPPCVLHRVILFPNAIRHWERKRFAHDENNFRFEFSGLWYADPERVQYATQLEGLSDKWQTSHDPAVWFSNLSPGKYTLRVRASLNNRFLQSPELLYSFVILPPFWKTWWFRSLAALAIVGAIWWVVWRRERESRELERLEKERIRFQFETLRSQVNPHFLFNSFNTLINLIERNPGIAATYAEQLSDFFRDIVANRDQPLIPLSDELRLLDTYIGIQKKRYGESIDVKVEVPEEERKRWQLPPMTLQLLAENAIKHNVVSREHPLGIRILLSGDRLLVENNVMPRLQPEQSTGLGLENIRKRFELLSHQRVLIEATASVSGYPYLYW